MAMKSSKVRWMVVALAVSVGPVLGIGFQEASSAPPYPAKEVTYVVGYGPGSGTDRIARALADAASPHLGKPIVVKNIPGATSTVAAVQVAKSKPDGYTVFFMPSINVTIHPHIQNLPYKLEDFEVLSLIWTNPYIWAVKPDSPYKTFDDLMADAKKRPGKVNYGHAGLGTAGHLALEIFAKKTGIKLQVVPFKGGNQEAVIALLGGHVDSCLVGFGDLIVPLQEGRMRALAASTKFPGMEKFGLKSMKELGYDIEFAGTTGNVAPRGMPKEISQKLIAAFKKGTEEKSFIEVMDKMQFIITYVPGDVMAAQWKRDSEAFGPIIKELGLKE